MGSRDEERARVAAKVAALREKRAAAIAAEKPAGRTGRTGVLIGGMLALAVIVIVAGRSHAPVQPVVPAAVATLPATPAITPARRAEIDGKIADVDGKLAALQADDPARGIWAAARADLVALRDVCGGQWRQGAPAIGSTLADLRCSAQFRAPSHINTMTVGSTTTLQYVYDQPNNSRAYLYFRDGVLTAMQSQS